jgi:predicted dehydrogenase
MNKADIGIGFVGAGGNTKLRHLPGFKEIEGVRLVSVANRSEASSQAVAKAFGVERTAPDWQAVVTDPEVDAVCIGTWPYMHAEITIAALRAGKHVLTEARMASDLAGAQAMLKASQAHPDPVAQIVPSPFTLPFDGRVMSILKEGELGEIREIFIEHTTGALLDPEAPLSWRQDSQYSGVNMLTMGIYHEVIQRWFPDVELSVTAATGTVFTKERVHWESGKRMAVELPDSLQILGRTGDGGVLNYHFSGVETGPARNEIRLTGSTGFLRLDLGAGKLYEAGAGEAELEVVIPDEEKGDWRVEADFIDSIREGKPVQLTSFEEGVRYMEFTQAAWEAQAGSMRGCP